MLLRVALFAFSVLLTCCARPESVDPVQKQPRPAQTAKNGAAPQPPPVPQPVASEAMRIRFQELRADQGLTVSITVRGDRDGETTFSNQTCCGVGNVRRFVDDVRVQAGSGPLVVASGSSGWTVRHAPDEDLTVAYRLPPSGETTIDAGMLDQVRPIVHDGVFHLIGDAALLLPTGRAASDLVAIDVDAQGATDEAHFVSSFGPGTIRGIVVPRSQITRALYLGGRIHLDTRSTTSGKLGIAYSGMAPSFTAHPMSDDVLAITDVERAFFRETQPWYLVSVRGGRRNNPRINIGGGMGLTQSFAMFVRGDLDLSDPEQREQLRWVLAHEYFHQWNGLALRVASRSGTNSDDSAVYWFSEGVTEFYTMRLLTRAGMQSPERSLSVLNSKLSRYASNSKRDLSAKAASALFWSSRDGEQIPYLRGYIAAWYTDLAIRRATSGQYDFDDAIRALVARAKAQPDFRLDNAFLVDYLSKDLPADRAAVLQAFVVDGGESPLAADSFAPCLEGRRLDSQDALQFYLSSAGGRDCFKH